MLVLRELSSSPPSAGGCPMPHVILPLGWYCKGRELTCCCRSWALGFGYVNTCGRHEQPDLAGDVPAYFRGLDWITSSHFQAGAFYGSMIPSQMLLVLPHTEWKAVPHTVSRQDLSWRHSKKNRRKASF